MLIRSINPATEEVIQEIPEFTDLEIEQTLARSQAAFESWRETGFEARAAIIKKTAAYLREHKSKLARIITDEVGKTLAAAEAEVEKSATACDYYAENAPKFLKPEVVATDASESYVRFDPIGPVLAIMPWNFPFWQVFRFAAPAIMAGNTGLLKHAISVQMSARAIVEAFTAAGLPDGVFQMMVVEPPRVKAIIQDPRVKAVTLTGSERAGSQVAMAAGEVIKKTVLELGGSDPFIVLADADLDAAVSAAVTARMQFNAGQSCIAGKRFIVAENLAGEFTAKLKTAVEKLVLGDPLDAKTDIGPLATDKMFETIQRQVKESVEKGATLVSGGQRQGTKGYFFQPTILADVKPGIPAYDEEIFGPVFSVITAKDSDDAVRIANDSQYGLGGTIFSADIEAAKAMAARIESGAVFINQPTKSDPRLPFGGVKQSGYGRELSHYGLKEFVNIKSVSIK